jgi:NADH-quinone oxidoreductase subunit H
MGGIKEIAVFMAGWGSRNKYALLGSMRGIAQMISYEIPLVVSALVVAMAVGSLSLVDIVNAQAGYYGGILAKWHVFTPWGLGGFLLFLVAATAESNRTPFDLPEGESEIIAGHMLEYTGFKYALFFLGEYMGLFAVSGLAITLYLGGWRAPFSFLAWIPSWLWFFGKLFCFIALFVWLRGTLPRMRADQLMEFAWKFMVPMVVVNIVVLAMWHYSAAWRFPTAGLWRWVLCGGVLLAAYLGLSKLWRPWEPPSRRVYRYAE